MKEIMKKAVGFNKEEFIVKSMNRLRKTQSETQRLEKKKVKVSVKIQLSDEMKQLEKFRTEEKKIT